MLLAIPLAVIAFCIGIAGQSKWWLLLCIPGALLSVMIDHAITAYTLHRLIWPIAFSKPLFIALAWDFVVLIVLTDLFRWCFRIAVNRTLKAVDRHLARLPVAASTAD